MSMHKRIFIALSEAPGEFMKTYLPQTGACRSHLTLLALQAVHVLLGWAGAGAPAAFKSVACMRSRGTTMLL